MGEYAGKLVLGTRLPWKVLALVAALSVLLAVPSLGRQAQAQEPSPTSAPASSCFDGALAADPLHCYVFEQAQAADKIDIEAMYQGGGALFVYLTQMEPVDDDALEFMRSKAQEEALRTGDHACLLRVNACNNGLLSTPEGYVLPLSQAYERILVRTGGEDARRSEPGWPSFRKLWPAVASGSNGASGASGASGPFDVSEVDTANIPPVYCAKSANLVVSRGCRMWERNPGLGIAGYNDTPELGYFQVKAPPGQEANVEAARVELHRRYPDFPDGAIIIIPVRYDFAELWRWATVLNRFAYTSGNTLGITGAWLGENWEAYYGDGGAVFPVPELPRGAPGLKLDKPHDDSHQDHGLGANRGSPTPTAGAIEHSRRRRGSRGWNRPDPWRADDA